MLCLTCHVCVNIISNINADIVTNVGTTAYTSILLEESDFVKRLQDRGCAESELPKKRYKHT